MVVVPTRTIATQGWTKAYEFSFGDLRAGVNILEGLLEQVSALDVVSCGTSLWCLALCCRTQQQMTTSLWCSRTAPGRNTVTLMHCVLGILTVGYIPHTHE